MVNNFVERMVLCILIFAIWVIFNAYLSSADFCDFFFLNQKNISRMPSLSNSLNLYKIQYFVRPYLDPNYLQKISTAEVTNLPLLWKKLVFF